MHRRKVLALSGVALSALGGCSVPFVLDLNSRQSGSLFIRNDHSQSHTVTINVNQCVARPTLAQKGTANLQRMQGESPSHQWGMIPQNIPTAHHSGTPSLQKTPVGTPSDQWNRTFQVASGQTVSRKHFITEPGTYYIVVQLEDGSSKDLWNDFGEGSDGGVTGGYIQIDIYDDGRFVVYAPFND